MNDRGDDRGDRIEAGVEEPESDTLEAWRAGIVDHLLSYTFIVAVIALCILGVEEIAAGRWHQAPLVLVGAILLGLAAFLKGMGQVARVTLFSGTVLGVCALLMSQDGYALPNAILAPSMACVVLALALGRRAAWSGLLVFCGLMLAIGALRGPGIEPPLLDRGDPALLQNWVRIALIYGMLVGFTITAVTSLVRRLERAARRNEELYRELLESTEDRIRALERERELERQLRATHEFEALGHLATGVAHDFNNLLVVILNNAALLERELQDLPDQARSDLHDILEAGERAADLSRQLLSVGREAHEAGTRFALGPAVARSLRLIRRLMPSNVEVELRLDPEECWIEGDPWALDQLVLNLCVNARDAMPAGGRLEVTTGRVRRSTGSAAGAEGEPSERACLRVRDSGVGMSPQVRERLFEPFFTTKAGSDGTGIGLSVVKQIVERIGGSIEVESAPGEGTTFTVLLPIRTPADTAAEPAHPEPPGGRETLLVVEDDPAVARVLQNLLARAGYRVLLAENGAEGLERFEANREQIRLVLTDTVMPEMGGWELHERIEASGARVPFLFCSGYGARAQGPVFYDPPHRELLVKPFTRRELLDAVRGLLDAHGARN